MVSVVSARARSLFSKNLKYAKKQRSKVEGKPIKQISLRLTSEKMKKLEEVMVKLGVGKVTDGEVLSEKLRALIDKLHDYFVTANQSHTSADKLKKKR